MKKIQMIALLAALIMFFCFYRILFSNSGSAGEGNSGLSARPVSAKAVVAVQDIAPYTTLTKDMVELREIAVDSEGAGYYKNVNDVVGKVATAGIFKDEMLTGKRITDSGSPAAGLALRLEKGKRAVTIEVDTEQTVANTIKVGNYVDVIYVANADGKTAGAFFDSALGAQNPANGQILHGAMGTDYSAIVMQKIKVISLNDKFYSAPNDPATGNSYGSITLEATPEQAAQLALMDKSKGRLVFTLRPQADDGSVNQPRGFILKNVK